MFYDKKIKYLNYMENGERIKGCGFIKIEIRESNLNLEMSISGLPPSLHTYTDVWLCTGGGTYSMGQICLEKGGGCFRLCNCNVMEISPVGVVYDDWEGIAVWPEEECEISAYWGDKPKCQLERVEVSKELAGEIPVGRREIVEDKLPVISIMEDAVAQKHTGELRDVVQAEPIQTELIQPGNVTSENVARHEKKTGTVQDVKELQMRMAEDKWEQISGIYPHIRPFQDKREYLSIRPADFVLLQAESYKAVNNSFLLHGYHNYQHLILARSLKKGKMSYYVGAPGNFFEREKQVAIMFGFTGFECAKDPAREGDFGYYLMEVQL